MKNSSGTRAVSILLLTGIFFMTARPVSAQNALATPVAQTVSDVVARGQHFKVLERVRQTTNFTGEVTTRTNHYTVVANGLNFQDTNGNWIESHPVVQTYAGGIACVGASYSVILATNLNTAGAVDLETSDGQRIISNPLGLGFYDPDTGKSVVLAQVKDCGAVVSSNHILYPDAFTGLKASVEYVYDIGHFHQNITLLTAPSTQPSDYGMGSRTRLEMLSELLQGPTPVTTTHVLSSVTDPTQRAAMAAPDVVDQTLKFGSMSMGLGRAYPVGGLATNQPGMTVPKQLINQSGRNILIESVPWAAASALLAQPQQSASIGSPSGTPGLTRDLPAARTAQTGTNFTARLAQVTKSSPVKLALNSNNGRAKLQLSPNRGFTMDYDLVESCTDYDFYEGGTFLVEGDLSLDGTTTIDDSVVLKYADFARLTLNGAILNPGYIPNIAALVLTSLDDDSVGDIIDGSTGNPSVDYSGAPALDVEYLDSDLSFAELDFSYCYGGLWVDNSPGRTLSVGAANYINVPGGNSIGSVNLVAFTSISVCNITGMTTSNEFTGANITVGSFIDCHDANGNGIPDDWEMANFGALVSATGDYDGDQVDNYHEWLNGVEPNKIVFTLAFTNQFVSTSNTVVTACVSNGVPANYAILVDSTNTAGASWTGYSTSNVTVCLGSTEGWHDVRIGLRGLQTTSQQTWHMWRLKYDHTPPVLVFTNPVSSPVNQPMLELQGYSAEALSAISYDLTNTNGLATNQQVLVLSQFYDTNTWETTTNFFQAFDVPLTVGTNAFTVHATDLAGNVTTTNLSYVLDYSSRTNPPVITLYWPTNGAQISGSNFTWRGQLDDFTDQLTVQTVDTNGNTNVFNGLVERNGNFWVENLPLTAGTNALTLMAVDAAGNTNQTNISVVQSTVNLTIGPVSWTNSTVTGTIDSTNYIVWVNGMQATNTGSNTWSAPNVPTEHSETMVVQARAIPLTDNGGNGTGGGGGTNSSYDVPGNPSSVSPLDAETSLDMPMGVYISSYTSTMYEEYLYGTNVEELAQWYNGGIGTQVDYFNVAGFLGAFTDTLYWPASSWPQLMPDGESWDGTNWQAGGDWPAASWLGITPQFGDVPEAWFDNIYRFSVHRAAKLSLYTGGKAIPGQMSLFQLAVSVNHLSLPPLDETDNLDPPSWHLIPTPVAPQLATVGNFGHPGAHGSAWAMLPPGIVTGSTVVMPGDPHYGMGVLTTNHVLVSQTAVPAPADTNLARTNIGVGEVVTLSLVPAITNATVTWSVSGGGSLSNNNGPSTIFTAPPNKSTCIVTATISDSNTPVSYPKTFNVLEPVSEIAVKVPPDYSSTGSSPPVYGAGMNLLITVLPTNVSFSKVNVKEVSGPSTNVFGIFTNTSHYHTANSTNSTLDSNNQWTDHCSFTISINSPPYTLPYGGGFDYIIPVQWFVPGGSTSNLPPRTQTQRLDSNGTGIITKLNCASTNMP